MDNEFKLYRITLDSLDIKQIIMALHASYLPYGKEYTDEEAYRYNSTIDGVIIKIKEQIDDKKNEVK